MNKFKLTCLVGLALSVMTAKGQNYTTPFNHCLLDEKVYDQLVGESSGEQAYYHILDVAPLSATVRPPIIRASSWNPSMWLIC